MIAPFAKLIDWSAVQFVTMRFRNNGRNLRLEEAIRFLNGPDFMPTESQSACVEFNGTTHFCFPTPRPCGFAENNMAYGRLYRCAGGWQERPVVVLLHGGGGFPDYRFLFPLIARSCNQAGFNATTFVAPYHFQRRPHQLRSLNYLRSWPETVADGACNFPGLGSLDYLGWAEAAAQAVSEIRALTGWFIGEGCPAVALWGISYGGWLAGLSACCDARLASVVLTVPGVRTNLSLGKLILRRKIRRAIDRKHEAYEALNLTPWNLASMRPTIPKENILLIEATDVLFAPKEAMEELWQTWRQPDIWRCPHGHVGLALGVPALTDRVLRWLILSLGEQYANTEEPQPRHETKIKI
jgi:pimeloyl-ACP methyl ester carboxylesterase